MSRALAAVGFGRGRLAEAGLDPKVIEEHRQRIHRHRDELGTFHGLGECIVSDGEVVYLDLCGFADKEHGMKMTARTLFRGNSLMKPMTATAFMTLVEEGRVGLDDPVSRYIPKFASVKVRSKNGSGVQPLKKTLTLRHLLVHTSGLGYGPGLNVQGRVIARTVSEKTYKNIAIAAQNGEIKTLEEFCDALSEKPLLFQPGTRYEYGYGMDVIGRVVEVVTGQPLNQVIQERVLTPAGMLDACWDVPRSEARRLSSYYRLMRAPGTDRWLERGDGAKPEQSAYVRGSASHFKGGVPSGGGIWGLNRSGLLFSMRDVALFCQMLLNGGVSISGHRVLHASTVKLLNRDWFRMKRAAEQPNPPGFDSPTVGWSPLGHVNIDGPHIGAMFMGGMSYFWMDFRRKVFAVIMTETFWEVSPLNWKPDTDEMELVLEYAFEAGKKKKVLEHALEAGKKRKAQSLSEDHAEKGLVQKSRRKA